jgi:hypothetical protein
MKRHDYKPDSDWTICHCVNSRFVAIVTFREMQRIEGLGERLRAVDCVAFESESQSECYSEAMSEAARDNRPHFTVTLYETWIITKPPRLAGKRDNRRIN